MNCRCGRPALPDDTLCARCKYYKDVFTPTPPLFESKKELALKAIYFKRLMKGKDRVVIVR